MHWFLNQRESISGYTQAFWSGLTTLELAKVTQFCIEEDMSGLVQPCPDNKISKFDLLNYLNRYWKRGLTITEYDEYRADKSLVNTREDFTYKVPSYTDMLIDLKKWMDSHKALYSQYEI